MADSVSVCVPGVLGMEGEVRVNSTDLGEALCISSTPILSAVGVSFSH